MIHENKGILLYMSLAVTEINSSIIRTEEKNKHTFCRKVSTNGIYLMKKKEKTTQETQRLARNVILKLEKYKATLSMIALPFRNIVFACDEAFQWKPYETSVLLIHLENCCVFSLTVSSLPL